MYSYDRRAGVHAHVAMAPDRDIALVQKMSAGFIGAGARELGKATTRSDLFKILGGHVLAGVKAIFEQLGEAEAANQAKALQSVAERLAAAWKNGPPQR